MIKNKLHIMMLLGLSPFFINANDVNAPIDEFGTTVLMQACEENSLSKVKDLLKAKADVNKADAEGRTALFEACGCDADEDFVVNLDLVKLLLDNGANVNHKAQDGTTPLFIACGFPYFDKEANLKLIELLISYGADVHIEGENGTTSLLLSAYLPDTALMNVLLNHGANINTSIKVAEKTIASSDDDWVKEDLSRLVAYLKKYKK